MELTSIGGAAHALVGRTGVRRRGREIQAAGEREPFSGVATWDRERGATDFLLTLYAVDGSVSVLRFPVSDPRTIARDIPGILDGLFPQLVPGVVAHFNRSASKGKRIEAVPQSLILRSNVQRSMLFELGVVAGEQLVAGRESVDWASCLEMALTRQRRHFDAALPESLSDADMIAALAVARNLAWILRELSGDNVGNALVRSPRIPGYQWIASGNGDFSVGSALIEVKCTNRLFSASDYRQVAIYWLLSYAGAVEGRTPEWTDAILVNPRLNRIVRVPFRDFIKVTSAGRSKVELLELFSAIVGDRSFRVSEQSP